jgi:hypothetical protein
MEHLVTIVVSDPWELLDENEGRIGFVARVVGDANGSWLLRLKVPVVYKRRTWLFAIPTPRYVGQRGFDDGETFAEILFITDTQAASKTFLSTFNSKARPDTPWVIGAVEPGIWDRIPPGSDSYTEPRWVPPNKPMTRFVRSRRRSRRRLSRPRSPGGPAAKCLVLERLAKPLTYPTISGG